MQALDLVRELVAIPGPPGQEGRGTHRRMSRSGCVLETDARGNLLQSIAGSDCRKSPRIVVMAHIWDAPSPLPG